MTTRSGRNPGNAVQSSDMWNAVLEAADDEGLRLLAHHIVRCTETIGELFGAEDICLPACDRDSDPDQRARRNSSRWLTMLM
jgi:hypothetical protein